MPPLRMLSMLSLAAALLALPATQAHAILAAEPPNSNPKELDLYELYNGVAGTSLADNQQLEDGFYVPNFETETGTNLFAVLLSVNAEYVSDLGYYTDPGVGSMRNILFEDRSGDGLLDPFQAVALPNGPIGFYLDVNTTGDVWFSESGLDEGISEFQHAAEYTIAGPVDIMTDMGLLNLVNASLVGWEDLDGIVPLDADYQDLVMLIGSMFVETPEPGTAAQLALGLFGLAWMGRRRERRQLRTNAS